MHTSATLRPSIAQFFSQMCLEASKVMKLRSKTVFTAVGLLMISVSSAVPLARATTVYANPGVSGSAFCGGGSTANLGFISALPGNAVTAFTFGSASSQFGGGGVNFAIFSDPAYSNLLQAGSLGFFTFGFPGGLVSNYAVFVSGFLPSGYWQISLGAFCSPVISTTDYNGLTIDQELPPPGTTSLGQFLANGTTPISQGGVTTETTVVFDASIQTSTSTDPLQFQVEVQPSANGFSGNPTAVASSSEGQSVTVTVSGLQDGSYHWAARVYDPVTHAATPWQPFSSNTIDFVVADALVPTSSTVLTDATTIYSAGNGFVGGCCPNFVMSPGPVFYHAPTPFAIQSIVVDDTDFSLNNHDGVGNIRASIYDLHGNLIARSTNTLYGESGCTGCGFAFSSEAVPQDFQLSLVVEDGIQGDGGFTVRNVRFMELVPTASIASGTLKQYKSDAMTTMFDGETTAENTVVFGATVQSSSPDGLQLQIELEPAGVTFTGIPNLNDKTVPSGTAVTVTTSSLLDGQYHWQARVMDTSTNTTSLWQTLSNPAAGIDFVVHQVPLVTQTDPRWGNSPYANGRGNNPNDPGKCGPTIGKCGCAITSVVMVLQYHGIITAVDNQLVNPLNVDAWLDRNNGYGEFGDLDWLKIEEYSQTSPNGLARMHYDGGFGGDTGLLDNNVNSLQPAILKVQVPTSSGGFAVHYIVAHTKLATTYSVRDPLLFNTKTLNDPVDDFANHIRAYGNQFAGLRLYSAFSGPVDGITFTIASPAQLLVIDPTGKRLGIDPISNTSYSEIPDGTYFTDGISDVSTSNITPAHEVKTAYIPNPIPGNYQVQVIGTASGAYSFSNLAYDANGTAHSQVFDGITQTNLVTPYVLNFTPQQPSNIVTASQIVFGGFLPPIKANDLGSYQQGQTIPIKFQLTDASGNLLTNRTAQLFVAKIANNVAGTDSAAISAGVANSGNTFRFDPTGNQYIFNLDTTPLDTGSWQVKMILDDGTSHTVVILIKS